MTEKQQHQHQDLLLKLEAESRAAQESFMTNLASKLKRPRVLTPPAHPFRGAPDYWQQFEWPMEERILRFMENFKAAGGYAYHLASMAEVKGLILGQAKLLGAQYVIRQDQPEVAGLELEEALPEAQVSVWNTEAGTDWKARAAEADIGIVLADYAAAYTGSVTVLSDRTKGRSVSLLPTVLFVIVPRKRLKTRLGEILPDFDKRGRENLPAGIHFISGPSRSADIENDLTIGVHGPGIVHAMIVDQL